MTTRAFGLSVALLAFGAPVMAQSPPLPSGQAAVTSAGTVPATPTSVVERQALDEAECKNLASQATGFIPGTSPAVTAAPQGPQGQRVAGAARGAAAGAIVGEMQGNNYPNAPGSLQEQHREDQAATGAALGVVAGGSKARQSRRQSAEQQQKEQADAQAKSQAWDSQYRGCMTQRGYSFQ
jgi:hypothetical protein